jgi:N-acetylneuraminic acid mutarotase
MTPGCGSEATEPPAAAPNELTPSASVETAALEAQALREVFPDHASAILDQSIRFQPLVNGAGRGDGHWLRVGSPEVDRAAGEPVEAPGSWSSMDVILPADASSPVRIALSDGFEVRITEIGAQGSSLAADGAVAYRRAGGTSFWTATAAGVEEWLHLKPELVRRDEAIATWEVSGGVLRMREDGQSAIVLDETGFARVAVAAPAAFTASGRPVDVRLSVEGDKLLLFVDAANEEVLVDPQWTATPPMSTTRALVPGTSTVLANGKVLVAGGYNLSYHATAELYDPATNTWSNAGSFVGARQSHTLTLLANGKVLLAGGYNGSNSLASASIYDPALNSWTAAASMNTARNAHAAARLPNGKVLVAGGYDASSTATASAEVYDPTTNTWAVTGSLLTARYYSAGVVLPDGRYFVAGGTNAGFNMTATAEIYNPATGTWSSAAPMAAARQHFTLTLLNNGSAMAIAGEGATSSAEIYTPATNTWAPAAPLGVSRYYHTAALMGSGNVLVAGGIGSGGNEISSAEIYNPANNSWTAAPNMSTPRAYHGSAALSNGKVLVFAGYTGSTYLSSAEIFSNGALGDGCALAMDCQSGFCADGVCCNAACGGAANDCMVCNAPGSVGTCTAAPMGVACRASAGSCDPAESCDGVNTLCPADVIAPSGTSCRATAGMCDTPETCTGMSALCPPDTFVAGGTVCRPAVDTCDAPEACSGVSAQCPADSVLAAWDLVPRGERAVRRGRSMQWEQPELSGEFIRGGGDLVPRAGGPV